MLTASFPKDISNDRWIKGRSGTSNNVAHGRIAHWHDAVQATPSTRLVWLRSRLVRVDQDPEDAE